MKKGGCRNLREEVYLLPTPVASDTGHLKSKYQQGGTPLSMAANLLPTPTVGNATGLVPGVAGGPLNPPWVEWLMGFEIGWTDCEPSETR
jgi:hypothetical protein